MRRVQTKSLHVFKHVGNGLLCCCLVEHLFCCGAAWLNICFVGVLVVAVTICLLLLLHLIFSILHWYGPVGFYSTFSTIPNVKVDSL